MTNENARRPVSADDVMHSIDDTFAAMEKSLAVAELDRLVWIGVGVATIILLAVTTGVLVREAVRSS